MSASHKLLHLGESVEENVRREVAEEVGLHVVKVEFCTSQHWALPASQLTLGCIATVVDKDVDVDSNEIENAKWVNADNLKDAVIRTRKLKKLTDIVEDVSEQKKTCQTSFPENYTFENFILITETLGPSPECSFT